MKRYVSGAHITHHAMDDDVWYSGHQSCTVHEPDRTAVPTGILDSSGVMIYSVEEIGPIGFVHIGRKA